MFLFCGFQQVGKCFLFMNSLWVYHNSKSALLKIAITWMMLHNQHHTTSLQDYEEHQYVSNIKHDDHHLTSHYIIVIINHFCDREYNIIQHDTSSTSWYIINITLHYQHHATLLSSYTISVTGYTILYNMIHYQHHVTLLSSYTISVTG